MKPNIQIKVSYCPNCKGDVSASIIFTTEINSFKKLESIVSSGGEFSCMDFKTLNEFNDEVQVKNLSEKTVSFKEYEREHGTFICGCNDLCRKVKSFEDACKILDISDHVPYFGNIPEKLKTQLVAHYKLSIITHVLNNGSQIDWNMEDSQLNTDSYYPRDFYKPKDDSDTGFCTYGHCENPERSPGLLCYLTEDSISEYAGVQFRDLYIELYQNPNNYIID